MSFKTISTTLITLCICVGSITAQERVMPKANNHFSYNGNEFDIYTFEKDTTEVVDPITGELSYVITSRSDWFISMNGERIKMISGHSNEEEPSIDVSYHDMVTKNLTQKVELGLKSLTDQLNKGIYTYHLENVIIDKEGAIVYHKSNGVSKVRVTGLDGKPLPEKAITADMQAAIIASIKNTLEQTKTEYYEAKGEKHIVCLQLKGDFEVL